MARQLAVPRRLETALSVAFFSFVGVALRMGMSLATADLDYGLDTTVSSEPADRCVKGSQANGFFLQNMVGCMLLAAIAKHKKAMDESIATGLASGLCGSLTTFGTWMQATAVAMLNGHVWMALVGLVSQLCVALCSYTAGHYLAGCGMLRTLAEESAAAAAAASAAANKSAGLRELRSEDSREPAHHRPARRVAASGAGGGCAGTAEESGDEDDGEVQRDGSHVYDLGLDVPSEWREQEPDEEPLTAAQDLMILGAGAAIIMMTLFLVARSQSVTGMLNLLMAPFGALLRWVLSLGNPKTEPFPVFTLVANVLGSAAAGVSGVMMGMHYPGDLQYELWSAFGVGFAGCLSTVSTFVGELQSVKMGGLRLRSLYAIVSFGFSLAVLLPLLGLARCPY